MSSLFSAEFYELAERHLRPRGILAQWLQLYELEPRLVASVMGALSRTFPDYEVYATDDANILILARKGGQVGELRGDLFADSRVAGELRRHHIHSVADLETRRIAGSGALQPFFDSWEVPANSDYDPFLDLNAVRSPVSRSQRQRTHGPAHFSGSGSGPAGSRRPGVAPSLCQRRRRSQGGVFPVAAGSERRAPSAPTWQKGRNPP